MKTAISSVRNSDVRTTSIQLLLLLLKVMLLNLWKLDIFRCPKVQTKCYHNRILFQKLIVEKGRQYMYSVIMKRVRVNSAAQKSN